jgi:hypothetical protein
MFNTVDVALSLYLCVCTYERDGETGIMHQVAGPVSWGGRQSWDHSTLPVADRSMDGR